MKKGKKIEQNHSLQLRTSILNANYAEIYLEVVEALNKQKFMYREEQ